MSALSRFEPGTSEARTKYYIVVRRFLDMVKGRLAENIQIIFKSVLGASGSGWYLMVGCSKDNSVAVSHTFQPITTRAFSKHERVVT